MRIDEFDYFLPPDRIAKHPPPRRGDSRLMTLERRDGSLTDGRFADLLRWLRAGDLLVANDTRVIPARLRGRREGGGEVEVLLLRSQGSTSAGEAWSCLARPGNRLRRGARVRLGAEIEGIWLDDGEEGAIRSIGLRAAEPILDVLGRVGEVPLPPYIDRPATEADREAYQTVYARSPGAVAAPTAGLHFTSELLASLEHAGVEIRNLTLHVGAATFLPVRGEVIENHRIEAEEAEIPEQTAFAVDRARREGRRVIAVGTTTVRALEGLLGGSGVLRGEVSLFIRPGHRFTVVDGMITNFHLPRSTLLMLVSAFAGQGRVLAAYREAVARGYRFYSYGDAMLIL